MVSKIIAATITPHSIPANAPTGSLGILSLQPTFHEPTKKETGHCGKRPVSQRRRISALNSGSNFGGTSTSCDNHFHLYKNLAHFYITIFPRFCSRFVRRAGGQVVAVAASGQAN